MTAFADRVLAGLGPTFAERAGALLPLLVDGLTSELAASDDLLSPAGSRAWPVLFDLDTTPYPGWLGQVAGTRAPAGLSRQEQREYIRARQAWRRGRPAAIKAAVAATLRGSQRVELIERDGSAWRLTVQVYASEIGDIDPALIQAAAESQKPVGVVVTIQVLTGATYAHMETTHGPTYADFAAAFPTYQQARDHIPEA